MPQSERAETQTGADILSQLLLDAREQELSADELGQRLAEGAQVNAEQLFTVYARGRFDVRVGARGQSTRALTDSERQALVSALSSLRWREYLDRRLTEREIEGERAAAVELYGALGTSRDVEQLAAWCGPGPERRRVPLELRDAFARAVEQLLVRDGETATALGLLYAEINRSLVPAVIEALASGHGTDSFSALVSLLGQVPEADLLVVTEIGHTAATATLPASEALRARVRNVLASRDRALVLETLRAIERLEDGDAVPELIELLESEDGEIAERAHAVLRSVTREQFAPRAHVWRAWYAEQISWWGERAPELLIKARTGANAVASRAVLELSSHHLYRHELSPLLAESLLQRSDEIVALTCAALGRLGSSLAVEPLLECLDDRSSEVRRAARAALRAITGVDAGESAEEWRAAAW